MEGVVSRLRRLTATKSGKLLAIGHASALFALLILSLRHFWVYPANHYEALVVILTIGFLPSLAHKLLPDEFAPYVLVGNALTIVSLVFVLMREWALAGVFVLIPVFSLLFQRRRIYIVASAASFALNVVLALLFLFDRSEPAQQAVVLLDVLTVFLILVFIIYFVVKELRWRYMAEARHLQTILTLSQSVEAKDAYTQGHSERVAHIATMLGERIPDLNTQTVYNCGLIHDVGKLSIPDSILLKKGRLTDEEYRLMKEHTTNGAKLCSNLNIPQEIVAGVLHHHERWDGRGYPLGQRGEQIPLIGRVLSVADAIDAMCSNRAYRNALNMDDVLEEIRKNAGTQFDPDIVRIALERWADIENYYRTYKTSVPAAI